VTCPTLALRRSALLLADVPDPARLVADAGTSLRRWLTGEGTPLPSSAGSPLSA